MNQLPDNITDILERISDAFVALDKNWCYTYMNKRAGEIFNLDPAKMTGKHIWTEFPEGIDQPFYKAYYRAMETQQYIYLEEYYAPYDLWFENHIYPSPEGLSIFFRDISESKKTEEGLRKNQRFIESIINATPDIIYIYDIEERKNVFSNDGIQTNLGYTSAEIKEMGDQVLPLLMPKEDFDDYIKNIYPRYATLKDKEILTHEFRMKHKTGSWHWLFTKESVFLRKPDGTPKQIFGVTVDITESKKAEEKLQKSEELFSGAFHASPAGIIITRITDGKIIDANESFLKMFEFNREETIGHTSIELNMLSDDVRTKLIQKQFESGGLVNYELLSQSKSGKPIHLLFSSKQLKINDELCHITTLIDITKRKNAEDKLIEQHEELKNLYATTPVGLALIDRDMRFVRINKLLADINGKPVEEHLGRTVAEVLPELADVLEPIYRRVLDKGESVLNVEIQGTTPASQNNLRYWLASYNPLYASDGSVTGVSISVLDITENKHAEQKLAENEAMFRTVIDTVQEVISVLDSEGKILLMNRAGAKQFGKQPEEIIGKMLKDFFPQEYADARLQMVRRIIDSEQSSDYNAAVPIGDQIRWYHISTYQMFHPSSRFPVSLSVSSDITDLKLAEDELRKSQQLFEKTFHSSPISTVLARLPDRTVVDVNEHFEQEFGYGKNEVVGKPVTNIELWDDPQEREKVAKILIREGKIQDYEFRYKTKSGSTGYGLFYSEIFGQYDERYVLTKVIDITERKKAEKLLEKREQLLSDSQRIAHIGSWSWDISGHIIWSEETYRIYGVLPEEFILTGESFLSLIHPDDLPAMQRWVEDCWAGKKPGLLIFRAISTEGKVRWLHGQGELHHDDAYNPLYISGTVQDITERKKAEEEIKSNNEKLRQLTAHLQTIRDEERKRISREIHDELGQQLTAIKMDVAWIDKKIPDPSAGEGNTATIKGKLKNINTLLDGSNQAVRKILSELRPGGLENQALAEALEWQGRQFTETTDIPVAFTASGTIIQLPEQVATCIFRVYQESLTNIMRHANAGKVLTSLKFTDDSVVLTIKDDGKGFDINSAADKKSFGILGMKERVASLNGKFELVSAKGKGTKIVVSMPYKQ